MSNFKGAAWFERFCEAAKLTKEDRYKTPYNVRLLYDQCGYLWRENLRTYTPANATIALLTVDNSVSEGRLLAHWDPEDDNIYRVSIDPLTQRVEVTSFGIDCLDTAEVGMYTNTSTLPKWMQGKLAVLTMMSLRPPTTPVEGVGQRINANTYWLTKKENDNG